jgi:hypothetical protein
LFWVRTGARAMPVSAVMFAKLWDSLLAYLDDAC